MLDEEFLTARTLADRGFAVRHFHVDEARGVKKLDGPREASDRIPDMLEALVEGYEIVPAEILDGRKIAADASDPDHVPRVGDQPGIAVEGRPIPPSRLHAVQEDAQAGAHPQDPPPPPHVVGLLWRQRHDPLKSLSDAVPSVIRADVVLLVEPRIIHGVD